MNATNRVLVWTAALLSLITTTSCKRTSNPTSGQTGGHRIEETHLGQIDKEVRSPVYSHDGCRFAYVTTKGQKQCVIVDGQAGPQYDGNDQRAPVFSADGKRVAYAAKKGEKQFVVVDGQPGAEHDKISNPTFSPDGVLEYLATKDNSLYSVKHTPAR